MIMGNIYHGMTGYLLSPSAGGKRRSPEGRIMGTVELLNGYYIEIDPLNYTLKQRYKGSTKEGAEREGVRICGYYPTLKTALKRFSELMRLNEIDGRHVSLYEYTEAIVKADKKVMEFLDKLEVRNADT